jgi:hypothetical protein
LQQQKFYSSLRAKPAKARGIVAEPPSGKGEARSREGDGADSPTRAHEVREAARPTSFSFFFKIFRLFAAIFGLFWRVGNFFEKKSPKKRILTKFIELF